ncbi:MAG: hypothetical protein ATN35_01780 [Epulopiscium sp. Nele67-Bin004]|nr:MAG: hypothetical protein ATN35_01780 [Epulopiscium sp. Nele67-Bin004]
MKKLLILNASYPDIPLIKEGKKLGYYVITTGNKPELVGHKFADEYHNADISDPQQILELVQKLQIEAICSCASDFGMVSASYVAEKMGLAGHDNYNTTLTIHHKDKFRKFCQEYNIPSPKAYQFTSIEDVLEADFEYPVIVKAVDLTSGHGVSKVETKDDLEPALQHTFSLSKQKSVVVEQYIEGTHHSFSAFLINKKVVAYFSANEFTFLNPYLISSSTAPAEKIEILEEQLTKISEKIANQLNLVDGIFHIQYILKEETPYILEITRRCAGDIYPYHAEHLTKLPWAEMIVKSECGIKVDIPKINSPTKYVARVCIMATKNGTINKIYIDKSIKPNMYQKFIWIKEGQQITQYLKEKIGVVLLEFDTKIEMEDTMKDMQNLIYVEVE